MLKMYEIELTEDVEVFLEVSLNEYGSVLCIIVKEVDDVAITIQFSIRK